MLGRHSLPVFIAGTILAMVAQALEIVRYGPPSLLFDTVLIATGIALQFAFAYYLEWLSKLRAVPTGRTEPPAKRPLPAPQETPRLATVPVLTSRASVLRALEARGRSGH